MKSFRQEFNVTLADEDSLAQIMVAAIHHMIDKVYINDICKAINQIISDPYNEDADIKIPITLSIKMSALKIIMEHKSCIKEDNHVDT